MKFTRTLFASVFGLSALPLSLALELAPDAMLIQDSLLSSGSGCTDDAPCTGENDDPYILGSQHEVGCCCGLEKQKQNRDPKHGHPRKYFLCKPSNCYYNVYNFACDPFRPDVCAPLYVTPEKDEANPINVPIKAANVLFDVAVGIATEDPFALMSALFSVPGLLASNDASTYDVTDEFVEDMARNVRNYVAKELTADQLGDLYNGISGNMLNLKATKVDYDIWVEHQDEPDADKNYLEPLTTQMTASRSHYLTVYPDYENKHPWDHPLEAKSGSTDGINGWGIYFSVFVSQMLTALMQQIVFLGPNVSAAEQIILVENVWKAIKHSQELVDAYVEQRESNIMDPTFISDNPNPQENPDILKSCKVNDTWVNDDQQCSWEEINPISYSSYTPPFCPPQEHGSCTKGNTHYTDCPKPIKDFVTTKSGNCASARKQFVTGTTISNWNTWLIEPSKKWAALADWICETSTESLLKTKCKNQGEDNAKIYNNKGGTAVDYVTSHFIGSMVDEGSDFVFGTYNTNECPHGATHITDRTRCETAYHSLAADYPNHVADVGYSAWKGRWPNGCFLNRDAHNSGVFFNSYDGGNSAGTGQPVCETNKKYRVQQSCQRDHPGHNVIATPVSYCHTDGTTEVCGEDDYKTCNWYYNSNDFIDVNPTGINHDWTCCVSKTKTEMKVNTAATSLVEASNDNPHNSHLPFSAMLGFLGLAMVATYKVVKDYRRHHHYHHHPHSKNYNKLDYESLMEA